VAEAVQTKKAALAIRLLIGPIPAVIFIAAFFLIRTYKLDEKTYGQIVAK
jgi:Na+/melibiose symporter-like transporter